MVATGFVEDVRTRLAGNVAATSVFWLHTRGIRILRIFCYLVRGFLLPVIVRVLIWQDLNILKISLTVQYSNKDSEENELHVQR
jgi:hypothetical protein